MTLAMLVADGLCDSPSLLMMRTIVHEELQARLAAIPDPTPISVFVLIWTFYEPFLKEVERGFARNRVQPLRFQPLASLTEAAIREQISLLHGWLAKPLQFDVEALTLVQSLDALLK